MTSKKMKLSAILKVASSNFRANKAAAFAHGLKLLTTAILCVLIVLGFLGYQGILDPFQLVQAIVYAIILFVADFALASDLALGLRFFIPDLFGIISLSSLVSGVTAVGSISIAWRWHKSQK